MSICEATTLDRISRPSATTAAAVSSQEDSIPNILKLTLCFRNIPLLPYASTRSPLSCFAPASESRDTPSVTFLQNYSFARIDKLTRSRLLCKSEIANLPRRFSQANMPTDPSNVSRKPMTAQNRVRKAVLPAAGLGTRFLPATKAQPKEMLTVVDKPQIQYVAEECVASGIEHIIIVTGKGKNSIEDHFDSAPALERFLEEKGKKDQAEMVRKISNMLQFSYTRQKEPLGLGHAVFVARDLVGDEPFAVLLGDVLIPGKNPATKQLIDVYEATGIGAIAVEQVPKDKTHLYGIVDAVPAPQPPFGERLLRIRDLVEKPKPENAPSNLAITGRYVLPSAIFDCLARTKPGAGNEIQLTDALRILAKEQGLLAYIYEGISYDAGDKLGFLKATVEIALQNPEFGAAFRDYLKTLKL